MCTKERIFEGLSDRMENKHGKDDIHAIFHMFLYFLYTWDVCAEIAAGLNTMGSF